MRFAFLYALASVLKFFGSFPILAMLAGAGLYGIFSKTTGFGVSLILLAIFGGLFLNLLYPFILGLSFRYRKPNDNEGLYPEEKDEIQNILNKEASDGAKIGYNIADECLENGLSKGEIVRLSEIENYISTEYSYNPLPTQNGFMKRISEYVELGTVVNINADNGDIIFVHKDHVNQLFENNK